VSQHQQDAVTGERLSNDRRHILGPDHGHEWTERTHRYSGKSYQTCWCGKHRKGSGKR